MQPPCQDAERSVAVHKHGPPAAAKTGLLGLHARGSPATSRLSPSCPASGFWCDSCRQPCKFSPGSQTIRFSRSIPALSYPSVGHHLHLRRAVRGAADALALREQMPNSLAQVARGRAPEPCRRAYRYSALASSLRKWSVRGSSGPRRVKMSTMALRPASSSKWGSRCTSASSSARAAS